MIMQITSGFLFIIFGIYNLFNLGSLPKKQMKILKRILNEDQIKKYRRSLSIPHFLIGLLCIIMGILESLSILNPIIYVGIYVILAIFFIIILIKINIKYTGYARI